MSHASWPPPRQSPGPRRPWATLALFAALALSAVVSLGGCWVISSTYLRKDSGVAQCEKLREEAEGSGSSSGGATFEQYRELRDTFEDSRHDDLRLAGVRWADVSWQLTQAEQSGTMRSTYQRLWVEAIRDLVSACADQDVDIRLDLAD